ncbi:hypothetical protein HPB51_004899 [Rhipicephalus microplus]|uniref:Uncharacterized protein n=1 Tax=Rhipicephalus microplus TaxID=6941 RepID=A0A9J6E704_RHIMP|nr:hypothetical protein HPB51_004899 [Rhipicephalus microplus]
MRRTIATAMARTQQKMAETRTLQSRTNIFFVITCPPATLSWAQRRANEPKVQATAAAGPVFGSQPGAMHFLSPLSHSSVPVRPYFSHSLHRRGNIATRIRCNRPSRGRVGGMRLTSSKNTSCKMKGFKGTQEERIRKGGDEHLLTVPRLAVRRSPAWSGHRSFPHSRKRARKPVSRERSTAAAHHPSLPRYRIESGSVNLCSVDGWIGM